jgi:ankyrin repeat protein
MPTEPIPFDIIFLISRCCSLSVLANLCALNRTLNQILTPHLYTLGAELSESRTNAETNPGVWALRHNLTIFTHFVKYGLKGNQTVTFYSSNKADGTNEDITFTFLHLMASSTAYIPGTNRSMMSLLGRPLGVEDINSVDSYGQTPLHWAAVKQQNWMWIVMLIQKGARTETRNRWGRTAMHIAAAEGNTEGIRMLQKMGAEVNSVDGEGVTPLGRAGDMGKEMAEMMLRNMGGVL